MERYFKDEYKVLATYKHHDGKYLKLLQEICDTPKKEKDIMQLGEIQKSQIGWGVLNY